MNGKYKDLKTFSEYTDEPHTKP